jgi:hypothetical protein
MKEKENRDTGRTERWEFYDNVEDVVEDVGGDTIREILRTLLVFSSLGVNVVVTDFTGTILLEDDLEEGNLLHLDEEPFIIPTGPRFLVPHPLDKEGRKLFFKGVYIPSFLVVPKCKKGPLMDSPILDHPYYVWTEVPDWLLERMGVASPMTAEVDGRDLRA